MPAPVLFGIQTVGVSSSQATIEWSTDQPTDGLVEYGTDTTYGRTTALQTALTSAHQQILTDLQAGQLMHYRVTSRNAAGLSTASADMTFTTVHNASTLLGVSTNEMRIYPNPWRKDRHEGKNVTVSGLVPGSELKIFTVSGHLIKQGTAPSNTFQWDLRDNSGQEIASGVYLFLATDANGQSARGKFAVMH